MTVKTAQLLTGNFVTKDATGALAAAGVGPAGTFYLAGVATLDAVTISGANPYKFSVTCPALTAGQTVGIYVTATISGIATGAFVFEDLADTSRVSDIATTLTSIKKWLQLAFRKDAAIAADNIVELAEINANMGSGAGGYVSTTDSQEAIRDALAITAPTANEIADQVWDEAIADHITPGSTGKKLTDASAAGDPWSAAVRTLTQSAASVAAVMSGSTISITRGDTATISLTGLGSIAARTKLWFTVKNAYEDADTAAILQVLESNPPDAGDGLQYINGATATTKANGTITVTDAAAGNLTITLDEVETAKLVIAAGLQYDIQMRTATTIQTMTAGTFTVTGDVTRATS